MVWKPFIDSERPEGVNRVKLDEFCKLNRANQFIVSNLKSKLFSTVSILVENAEKSLFYQSVFKGSVQNRHTVDLKSISDKIFLK